MILTFTACTIPLTETEKIQIMDRVQQEPQKSLTECTKLTGLNEYQECVSMGAHALIGNPQLKRTFCEQLKDAYKAECYFELAEETNILEDCQWAGQFTLDCQSHILQRQCGRYNRLSEIQNYITQNGIDFTNGIEGLMYRCILDNKPYVPIDQCDGAPNQNKCILTAMEIYQLQLNSKPFNCTAPPRHADTSGHPQLEQILAKYRDQRCPNQD